MAPVPVPELSIGHLLAAAAVLLTATAAGFAAGSRRPVAWVRVTGTRQYAGPGVRAGDSVDVARLDSAAAALRQALVDGGRLWATVRWDTTPTPTGVGVVFAVEPGPQARVAGWRVTGNRSFDEARLSRELPRRGTRFSAALLERASTGLLDLYERNGFPLAAVEPGALHETLHRVVPGLAVSEGPRVAVAFLAFSRPVRVPASLLERVAGFRAGRTYSPAAVLTWRRNLERTGWLRCDSQALAVDGGIYGLQFWVTGLPASRVSAAAGYSSAERFTGFARLRLLNLLNTGRRLEAGLRLLAEQQEYDLAYTEPWLFGSNVTLAGSARHAVYDTTRSRTDFEAGGSTVAAGIRLGLDGGWYRVTGGSSGSAATTWAGTGLEYDARDGVVNPRGGYRVELRTRVGERRDTSARAAVGRVEVAAEWLVPAAPRFVLASAVHGRAVVSGKALEPPELYTLGGAASLRGFREDAFTAPVVAWLNCEPRYLLTRSGRVYPFCDCGAYRSGSQWRLAAAWGLGSGWQTRAGRLGLDYGVGFGESPLSGKVHLSFDGGF